ncbi:MAG: hypothetical protein N2442_03545 [Spirochaetes bacterium]|nr:hypothetical protein [Spirochaetota bacterium]
MDRDIRVIVLTILGFLGIGLLYAFLAAYFSVPVLRVGNYKAIWILGTSLETLITHFIPLVTAGMILATSLWVEGETLQYSTIDALHQLRKLFFLSLGVAILFGILQEGVLPWATQMKQSALRKTQIANELRDKAFTAERTKEYSNARFYLEYYLTLFPKDDQVRSLLDKIREKEREQQVQPSIKPQEPMTILKFKELTFQDLQEKAIQYYQEQDFVAAEYFSLMALKLKPNHPEMLRLLASSQNTLNRIRLTPDQEARRSLFQAKQQGYEYLKQGDPISAYYHFQELSKRHPKDSEIAKYLHQAYEEVKKKAFFQDEISLVTGEPLASDLLFKNSFRNGLHEFLFFSKIIATGPSSYYVFDIEGIGIEESGKVAYRFKAPFGKFVDSTLLMHCLNRKDPNLSSKPTYMYGDPPTEPSTILPIKLKPQDLVSLARLIHSPMETPFATAISLIDLFPVASIEPMPVVHSLLMRLQGPFICLNISVLVLILGRMLHSKYYTRPPLITYLSIPFLPVLFTIGISLLQYELSILISILIDKVELGFVTAGIVLLGFQGIFLLAILFYGVQSFTRETA